MFANFRCVEHHLCNGDGEIITDGGDIFSFRNPFNVGNSKCPGFTEVCCRKEEFRDIPIGGTVTVKAPSKKCKECHNDGYVGIKIYVHTMKDNQLPFFHFQISMCSCIRL